MLSAKEQRSKVARLLEEISAEHEMVQLGFTALGFGTCTHAFVSRRMESMYSLHGQLRELVGNDAIAMIAHQVYPTLGKKKEKAADDSLT